MSTTTIRLPDALKARVAKAAKRSGTSAHSFILEAITEKAEQAEKRSEFHAEAERRYEEIVATGKTIGWNEMRRYMEQLAVNKSARKPRPRRLTG